MRTIHGTDQSPGAGGWPTIRYFNTETGYGGKPYPKKTDKAMCDELGPSEDYMQQYVEEQGGTSLCDVTTLKGCSEQAKTFIGKWAAKPKEDKAKQLERLSGMTSNAAKTMKPEAVSWLKQRISFFKQFQKKDEL